MTAQVFPFVERSGTRPRTFRLTIIARDPSVLDPRSDDDQRRILRAVVDVPASRLDPGPRGPRFHVVDFDATAHVYREGADLAPGDVPAAGWGVADRYADADDATLLTSPEFRAQNVYAIAARTLAVFEFALGRPVPWAFGGSQLYLVPTAFAEANAYYADDDQALYFGYFPTSGPQPVLTCLAHDIVAHETTHAILDGLRRRFDVPSMPDQAGFHEGFADVVALLSILGVADWIEVVIGRPGQPALTANEVSEEALRSSVLFTIGKQFGDELHRNRGGGLRRSVELLPTKAWRDPTKREWQEPHRRGEVLVATVMQAFLRLWLRRLDPLVRVGSLDRRRVAEEGARAARHLLEMSIRAIDYCPPVDFTLDDFLAAVLASDAEVAPDDELDYRGALRDAFEAFGIVLPPVESAKIAFDQWPSYRNFSYAALRSDGDEAFRFLWENAGLLRIDPRFYLHVENVRPSVRVGPRGFVVAETVVDYVQELILTRRELDQLAREQDPALAAPADIPEETQLKLWGGGTIIFDEFGALKYHHVKPLADWPRQIARLEYLVAAGLWDSKGRIGFSYGAPLGQRFAQFHEPYDTAEEVW